MEQQPLVSVIINCYNGEKYLREAIDSVIAQTYTNWEIIFWDNQSTDSTADIVRSYKDERIRYFYAPEHTPLGEARNLAMKEAYGEYIGFLDADDVWKSEKLKKEVESLQNAEIGLVYTDYHEFGLRKVYYGGDEGYRTINSILCNYDIAMSSALVRKTVIDEYRIRFNNDYQLIEDLDFFVEIALHTSVFHIKEDLVGYRVYGSSLSDKYKTWHIEYKQFLQKIKLKLTDKQIESCREGIDIIYKKYLVMCYNDAVKEGNKTKILYYGLKQPSIATKLSALIRCLLGNNIVDLLKQKI